MQLAMTGGNVAAAEELLKAGADIEIGEEDEDEFEFKGDTKRWISGGGRGANPEATCRRVRYWRS